MKKLTSFSKFQVENPKMIFGGETIGAGTTYSVCTEYSHDKNGKVCDEDTYKYNDKGDQISHSSSTVCKE
ncbi:MAG: hypothetical protein ACK50A_11230 [Sphingobacteriaceae bacterium]